MEVSVLLLLDNVLPLEFSLKIDGTVLESVLIEVRNLISVDDFLATAKLYFRDQVLKTFTGIVLDSDYSLFTYTASTPWFSLFGAQNTAYSVYTADVLFYGTAALSDAQMITNLASPPSTFKFLHLFTLFSFQLRMGFHQYILFNC